jgi:hypothetical protein
MRKRAFGTCVSTLLVLLTCVSSGSTFAWGAKGHRVIGALAEERLTPAAHAAIAELLDGEDLATASTWADEMRASADKPEFWSGYAGDWHFVNIAPGEDYASSKKNPRGDAYVALATFVAILLDEPVPAGPVRAGLELYFGDLAARKLEVRRFALKFLVHILGDLQQPLHSGYASDRGGNSVELSWFGERSNLHSIWDARLVGYPDMSAEQLARRLAGRIGRTPASDVHYMESAAPLVWIEESHAMLDRIYAQHAAGTELGTRYTAQFVPTVDTQLVKGGLRTAYVLNSIFGGWPIGQWRDSPTAGEGLAGP